MPKSAILQEYLDFMSDAVLRRDFATYRSGVHLPFCLITHDSGVIVSDTDELKQGFDAYCDMLRESGVTEIRRVAQNADEHEDRMIAGSYTTRVLSGEREVFDAYRSQIVLQHTLGQWQAVWISNTMSRMAFPREMPWLDAPKIRFDPDDGGR